MSNASTLDMEEGETLNAWLGKHPDAPTSKEASESAASNARSSVDSGSPPPSPSSAASSASDVIEIPHRPAVRSEEVVQDRNKHDAVAVDDSETDELQREDSEADSEPSFVISRQNGLTIVPPQLTEEESEEYGHLPGHFNVKRILYALGTSFDRKFIAKLASGEIDLVGSLAIHRTVQD